MLLNFEEQSLYCHTFKPIAIVTVCCKLTVLRLWNYLSWNCFHMIWDALGFHLFCCTHLVPVVDTLTDTNTCWFKSLTFIIVIKLTVAHNKSVPSRHLLRQKCYTATRVGCGRRLKVQNWCVQCQCQPSRFIIYSLTCSLSYTCAAKLLSQLNLRLDLHNTQAG